MFDAPNGTDPGHDARFARSVKAAMAAFGCSLHTRLELFVTELEEERERLNRTILLMALFIIGIALGFILLHIFVVALLWERGWLQAIAALAAIYLGVGAFAGMKLRKQFLTRPGFLAATLGELEKDRNHLRASWHD